MTRGTPRNKMPSRTQTSASNCDSSSVADWASRRLEKKRTAALTNRM